MKPLSLQMVGGAKKLVCFINFLVTEGNEYVSCPESIRPF